MWKKTFLGQNIEKQKHFFDLVERTNFLKHFFNKCFPFSPGLNTWFSLNTIGILSFSLLLITLFVNVSSDRIRSMIAWLALILMYCPVCVFFFEKLLLLLGDISKSKKWGVSFSNLSTVKVRSFTNLLTLAFD